MRLRLAGAAEINGDRGTRGEARSAIGARRLDSSNYVGIRESDDREADEFGGGGRKWGILIYILI